MSWKISQINFSFIQHLQVGENLYITDQEHLSLVCHGFRFGGRGVRFGLCVEGKMYCSHAWTTTFTCILYIHGSFTNTPKVFMICFPQKATDFFFRYFLTPTFRYIPPKKSNTFPFTTLKIQKVETACCKEMRIEKEKEKNKRSRFPHSKRL